MAKKKNSVNVSHEHAKPILKFLFSNYDSRHKDDSALNSYPFTPHHLYLELSEELVELINTIKDKHNLAETEQTVLGTVLNGFVKNDLLKSDDCVVFNFTPRGYKFALKYSSTFRYLWKYHPATLWAALSCIIGGAGLIATLTQ
ncbi:hypothetical protein [Salinivibrio costicola]|uniref:Uncharacterized protein n=1 Tax=Salinivibrio costicola subsp. alcaliphilus TaxID=272773 RepID=A0ABX3KME5_SALCS|nr:hypothetical protein [Salinivibrio costicola]OOF32643.1 hypothetical protein BZJ21_15020 [Salinivibrio costicola subsp. alcaliphilus]